MALVRAFLGALRDDGHEVAVAVGTLPRDLEVGARRHRSGCLETRLARLLDHRGLGRRSLLDRASQRLAQLTGVPLARPSICPHMLPEASKTIITLPSWALAGLTAHPARAHPRIMAETKTSPRDEKRRGSMTKRRAVGPWYFDPRP